MTSKEFVLWLKGFTDGVHEFNITPKQWDTLKEKLAEVDDNTITIANPPFGFGSTSTTCGYPSGSAWHYTNNKPHNED